MSVSRAMASICCRWAGSVGAGIRDWESMARKARFRSPAVMGTSLTLAMTVLASTAGAATGAVAGAGVTAGAAAWLAAGAGGVSAVAALSGLMPRMAARLASET